MSDRLHLLYFPVSVLSDRLHLLYFPVSVLSDPTLTTSVYPVCCTAITRSWQYTGYSASVWSEIKNYSQCHTSFMSVCCQTDIYVTSLLSVCRQSVGSVLSETLFIRAVPGHCHLTLHDPSKLHQAPYDV